MTAGLPVLAAVARADFFERSRRYSFLITLALMLYAAHLFLPAKTAKYVTIDLDGWRGVYNSAWVGANVAVMTSVFLSLIGFYLVKNALERDRRTGVGEVVATTVLPSRSYLAGKWLSNVMVLAALVVVLSAAALALQWIRGEDTAFDLPALFLPFFIICLPALALAAAFAILFESVKWLSGALGNVVWFFLWMFLYPSPTLLDSATKGVAPTGFGDPGGIGLAIASMVQGAAREVPGYTYEHFSMGFNIGNSIGNTFQWPGISWTAEMILGRLFWIAVSAAIVLMAVPFFNRFDPAREGWRGREIRKVRKGRRDPEAGERSEARDLAPEFMSEHNTAPVLSIAPLISAHRTFDLLPLLGAELRLALKGYGLWWYIVALGLLIAGLFVPPAVAQRLLPISWIWPLPVWSALGCREQRHGTGDIVFSSPRPLARLLPAVLLCGVLVALLTGLAAGLRHLVSGDMPGFLAWLIGAAFIASFAVASGVWTGSGKMFEVVYLLVWYMGPMQGFAPLDFMGTTPEAITSGATARFGALALVFVGLAVLGRRRVQRN